MSWKIQKDSVQNYRDIIENTKLRSISMKTNCVIYTRKAIGQQVNSRTNKRGSPSIKTE